MKKLLVVGVIVLFLGISVIPSTGTLMMQHETLTELIIEGPTHGKVGYPLTYGFLLTGQEGCDIWYYVDWDDGTNPDWFGPYEAGEIALVAKTWYECGIYNFSVQAEGCDGTMYSETFKVTIHQPPSVEFVNPREGYFHFSGIPLFPTSLNILADTVSFGGFRLRPIQVKGTNGGPDGDPLMVWLFINGEDKGLGPWNPETGYYEWQWIERATGTHYFRVKARDVHDIESDWASITIWNFCFIP